MFSIRTTLPTLVASIALASSACETPAEDDPLLDGADTWSVSGSVEDVGDQDVRVVAASTDGQTVEASVGADGAFSLDLPGGSAWSFVLEGLTTTPLGITLEGLATTPLGIQFPADSSGSAWRQAVELPAGTSSNALARSRNGDAGDGSRIAFDLGTLSLADGWAFAERSPLALVDVDRDGVADLDDTDVDADGVPDRLVATPRVDARELPPHVTEVRPRLGAEEVPQGAQVTVRLNQRIDAVSLRDGAVRVVNESGDRVDGNLWLAGDTLTFYPSALLDSETTYEVVLDADVATVDGGSLGHEVRSAFRTMPAMLPAERAQEAGLAAAYPQHRETGVPTDFRPSFCFAKLPESVMDLDPWVTRTYLGPDGEEIAGEEIVGDYVGVFEPDEPFLANSRYTVRVAYEPDASAPMPFPWAIEIWFETGADAQTDPELD